MIGRMALVNSIMPTRLIWTCSITAVCSKVSTGCGEITPAQEIKRSIRPQVWPRAWATSSILFLSARSHASIWSTYAVPDMGACWRDNPMTRYPRWRSRLHNARPMPPEAPLTTAVFWRVSLFFVNKTIAYLNNSQPDLQAAGHGDAASNCVFHVPYLLSLVLLDRTLVSIQKRSE